MANWPTPLHEAVDATPTDRTVAPEQPHTEVFIGLVAPIGTDLRGVTRELEKQLKVYNYIAVPIGLSDFLPQLSWDAIPDEELAPELRRSPRFPDAPYDERVWTRMSAGDKLREVWSYAGALALLGISRVEQVRHDAARATGQTEPDPLVGWPTLDRHAYVFRSLKNAGEVQTLREVYGPRFFLIGAHCSETKRADTLHKLIAADRRAEPESDWKHAPSQLISRDWQEEVAIGQDVSGTFHQADFFIDAETAASTRTDLRRTLRILFGDPYETPTTDEYGMVQAASSARRSAELGRQVGAALTSDKGSVIALGLNEVPAFGGGPYGPDHPNDAREFTLAEETNTARRADIVADVVHVVSNQLAAVLLRTDLGLPQTDYETIRQPFLTGLADSLMQQTGIRDLTEYGRATHAEMSALLDAGRRGVSVESTTMYVTTFPCHTCARAAVEAGVRRVVFIEPYAKSQALDLHQDSIELRSGRLPPKQEKLAFQPFVGVAPSRYLAFFDAEYRKQLGYPPRKQDGEPVDFDQYRPTGVPLFTDRELEPLVPEAPVYKYREGRALRAVEYFSTNTPLAMVGLHSDGE